MRQGMRFLVGVWLLCVATSVVAASLPKGVSKIAEVEGIHEYRLSNGLKVLLLPDESKPTVTVNVTYLVGSRHENYGETGMAHLLEHLLFKGSSHFPKIDQEFNRRGMNANATTSLDRTHYYESFQSSSDNLKWAIAMEADRMVNSFVAKKDLDSEMTVVRNEFESGENSPFRVLWKRMQSITFDWHNYGNSTIGNRSDIENVKIENLQGFYRRYYQPDNAALVIAGKFDQSQTLAWIAQSFGKIAKPTRKLPELWTVEPTQDGERSVMVRRKGDVQMLFLGYRVPASLHADSDALTLASNILTDIPNGRLYKLLVETGKATRVYNLSETGFSAGLQMFGVIVKKGEAIEPVRDALITTVEDFYKNPPTREEMARELRNHVNNFERMNNDPQYLSAALTDALVLGDWRLLLHSRDVIAAMKTEQVAAAAARYFKRDNRTVGIFAPEDSPQRADIPATPSTAEVLQHFKPHITVAAGEKFDPSQANIDRRTQREQIGGLKVALLPKKNRGETVAVSMKLHWGDEKSLFGQSSVAMFTQALLARGTTQFTRQQLADEFERLKISGNIEHFETTRPNLVAALKLMAHILKEPVFPASEFEQFRKQALTSIETSRNDPRTLANEALAQHFNRYPQGDWRAAKNSDEKIAEIQSITLDKLKAFHQQFYGASNGELAIVGDFDAEQLRQVIRELYGNWQSPVPYTRIAMQNFDVAPLQRIIHTPDKENGTYQAAINLDKRDDDSDYAALLVANYLLGGGSGLDSRLMQRVRQKEGLSYHISSSLNISALDRAASFNIYAIAAPQNMHKVAALVQDELTGLRQKGFSAAEVARAKSGILQQYLQSRAADEILVSDLRHKLFLNRTLAWSKQLEDKISALTAEQVNVAFRLAIDPAKMSVVMAFDQGKVK